MDKTIVAITGVVVAITGVISALLLFEQLRKNRNVNKSHYLLTIDKFFAENQNIQKIYNILSDHNSCPILCSFGTITSNEYSTYLTFMENFNILMKKNVLTKEELYDLFGHRIFSVLHNQSIQYLEIDRYKDNYRNLFALHEALFIYCIKNNRKIPHIQNAGYFTKDKNGYRKVYEKYIKEIESRTEESMKPSQKDYISVLSTPIINKIRTDLKIEVRGCYFRECCPEDYPAIIKIQEKVVAELKENGKGDLFISTPDEDIKRFLNREDIYFICLQTPDGICAYSYTFFNNKIEYDLSEYFKNKRVATFDTVVVLPGFRGNKLHDKLLNISIKKATRRGCDIMAATVSPNNEPSVNNFVKNGFDKLEKSVNSTLYEGYDRIIMYKKLL